MTPDEIKAWRDRQIAELTDLKNEAAQCSSPADYPRLVELCDKIIALIAKMGRIN